LLEIVRQEAEELCLLSFLTARGVLARGLIARSVIARSVVAIAASAIFLVGSAASAALDAEDQPSIRIRLVDHAKLQLRLIQLYQSRSEMDGADLIASETILRPSLRVPYAKWGEIDLSTRYDVRHYDFDGRSNLVDDEISPGTPFKSLNAYRVRLGTNIRLSEKLYWSTGAISRAKWESGADVGDAMRLGGFMAVGLQPVPRIFIGIGVGVKKRLHGGDLHFGPLWRIQWRILDRVDLLVENLTSRIRIDLNRQFQLQLIAKLEERTYQLRDRGGNHATEFEERKVPVRLRLVWRANDHYRVEFDLGAYFEQRLRTDAADTHQSIDQGTTVFVGVGVRFRN